MTTGQRLRKARKERGMTQDMLAEKIGTSRGVITNIERNIVETPQPVVVNALCHALHINREWLLNGEGPMDMDMEAIRSANVLFEIYTYAKELSEPEQLFILDMIKTYTKRLK